MKSFNLKNHNLLIWSILSTLIYVVVILYFRYISQQNGSVVVGPINYDSYYLYSYANEYARTKSGVYISSPFGTLDTVPKLFHLYSFVLSNFQSLYFKNFFIFDLIIGSLFTFIGNFILFKSVSHLKVEEKVFILFGQGLCFIGVQFFGQNEFEPIAAAFWGLSPIINQIATPEIIYHAIFYLGLFFLLQKNFFIY